MPGLGVAAAIGLILYFVGALPAHRRLRDYALAPAAVFVLVAAAARTLRVASSRGRSVVGTAYAARAQALDVGDRLGQDGELAAERDEVAGLPGERGLLQRVLHGPLVVRPGRVVHPGQHGRVDVRAQGAVVDDDAHVRAFHGVNGRIAGRNRAAGAWGAHRCGRRAVGGGTAGRGPAGARADVRLGVAPQDVRRGLSSILCRGSRRGWKAHPKARPRRRSRSGPRWWRR
ncbi:hypothetical protein [Embleya sp. NPDC005575]|uniref:hypothetical protein n=1 Tax=Embleya sp. NPDC005575 TaxID=3156892 RepID=UPI0033B247B1